MKKGPQHGPSLLCAAPQSRDRKTSLSVARSNRLNRFGRFGFFPLFVFDNLCDHGIARETFKRALVVIRLVRLNLREPHRHPTVVATWMLDFMPSWNELRLSHDSADAGGSATGLSATDACGKAAAGDNENILLETGTVCPVSDFGQWSPSRNARFVPHDLHHAHPYDEWKIE